MRLTLPSWQSTLVHAAALAAAGTLSSAALAVPPDALSSLAIPGTWYMKETRAGNLCEARADFSSEAPVCLAHGVSVL